MMQNLSHLIIKTLEKNPKKISKNEPFINPNDRKGIDFPSHSKDLKKLEQNNTTIARNILFVSYNTKEIRLAKKSKHNFKHIRR